MRLFTLQIPLPNLPPIIIAALPIADNLDATALVSLSRKIIDGLVAHNIRVVSYACDGTETERAVERLLVEQADSIITQTITNPREGLPDIVIEIPVFGGFPIVMIQDSKHALKTARNNLFSGARFLAFGNAIAIFQHIRDAAFEPGSPLYHRDVEKLDRQDDNAALRLFSSAFLQYLVSHHPDYIGEIVYLFVFGELVDAYQNRHIPHIERIKMVLRVHFFLEMWETYLAHTNHPRAQFLISREALDIAHYLINGLLSLVFVYRDYIGDNFPLLPWNHSTEACEHFFGDARKIIKDFTLLDFFQMLPKLMVKIREAIGRAQAEDGRQRAAGYNHTYFDVRDIDLPTLRQYPTNDDINLTTARSASEADSLVQLFGIIPAAIHKVQARQAITLALPGINAWYKPPLQQGDDDSIVESDDDSDEKLDATEAVVLQGILRDEDDPDLTAGRSATDDRVFSQLTHAALAVTADDLTRL